MGTRLIRVVSQLPTEAAEAVTVDTPTRVSHEQVNCVVGVTRMLAEIVMTFDSRTENGHRG